MNKTKQIDELDTKLQQIQQIQRSTATYLPGFIYPQRILYKYLLTKGYSAVAFAVRYLYLNASL